MRHLSFLFAFLLVDLTLHAATVDFASDGGRLRRELHSSGLGGQLLDAASARLDELKPLNLYAARTHDWALFNPGQRIVDTHFLFPLLHADADDSRNYFFAPTDEILEMTTEQLGMKVWYRLGTSIESVNARRKTGARYYNSVEPTDWDQYVKALSHIIRHYTRGWANGKRQADMMPWWELWNEPNDSPGGSWINADGDMDPSRNFARFRAFSVYVLKRLKAEFPELKFGGPATCFCDVPFLRAWLLACRNAGYVPDFVSWHNYACRPAEMLETPAQVRRLCDELGFPGVELVINEWHYIPYPEIWGDFGATPEKYRRIIDPVNGLGGIESAVHTLQVIEGLQFTTLGQSYLYVCHQHFGGNWGIRNADGSLNKVYYALRYFGEIVGDCDRLAGRPDLNFNDPVQAYGYLSKDRRRCYLSVSRFKGGPIDFSVTVKGLGDRRLKSVRLLDVERDFESVLVPSDAEAVNNSFTPFSPGINAPIYRREGDVFRFRRWEPTSSAALLVFE